MMQLLRFILQPWHFYTLWGSGGGGSTQTVQKSDPWAGQQPYLLDVMQRAQQQSQPGAAPQYFPGATTAPQDPNTIAAQQMLLQYATGAGTDLSGNLTGAENFALGPLLDPNTNPYLQSSVQGAITPAIQAWQNQILPGIRGDFQMAGQPGGTRQGVAEGIGANALQQNILNTTSGMYNQAYQGGLNAFTKALALGPQTLQAGGTPAQQVSAVGQQQQDFAQQMINDAIAKWNYQQNLPNQQLAMYNNLIQGNMGSSSFGTTQTTPARVNPILGLGGGAAMGAAIGSVFPGIGTAVGAGVGAIVGLLGTM